MGGVSGLSQGLKPLPTRTIPYERHNRERQRIRPLFHRVQHGWTVDRQLGQSP
nr:MAG TPA: hypothetical protein [Caudoviricetes sp.]